MGKKEEEFLKRLQATFRLEAEERIGIISSALVELEKISDNGKRTEVVESIFREAHSLKGAARSVNMTDVEAVCQSLESILASLKRGETEPSAELFDMIHRIVDTITDKLFPGEQRQLPKPEPDPT